MPTYEYACKSCGSHIEVVQAFTDDALTECTSCGGDLRKVFGSIGISFKGSGFYKNDSRSSSSSTAASSESKPGDAKPAETKSSETKPAAKSETKTEPKSSKSSDVKAS